MKPYRDPQCKCWSIQDEINQKYPDADWNSDEACDEWCRRQAELVNNDIEFEPFSDEYYSCTCPTCGRVICIWCI